MQAEKSLFNEEVVPGASSADKKYFVFGKFLTERNIQGFQLIEHEDDSKIYRSNLMIDGQTLPLHIVLNNSVYSSIQIQVTTLNPDKAAKCLAYLNDLNIKFDMLKYFISGNNVILTCSIPASDDGFESALIIAVLDQVKIHLENTYAELMKNIWAD